MIQTPLNQKILTNVAIVKLKKGGKHFELACYCNKIANWRNKQELNLNEVVQIEKIFLNATRGELASKKDLKVFGNNMTEQQIFMEILNKGEFQVSDLERELQLDNLRKEIATLISSMCVNKTNLNTFPMVMILKAMNEAKVKLDGKSSAKKQALDIIKDLESVLPIKRAQMRTRTNFNNQEQLLQYQIDLKLKFEGQFEEEKLTCSPETDTFNIYACIDPHLFRGINDIFQKSKKDKEFYKGCNVEILEQQIRKEDEEDVGLTDIHEEVKVSERNIQQLNEQDKLLAGMANLEILEDGIHIGMDSEQMISITESNKQPVAVTSMKDSKIVTKQEEVKQTKSEAAAENMQNGDQLSKTQLKKMKKQNKKNKNKGKNSDDEFN